MQTTTQQMNHTCRECGGPLDWYEQPALPPRIPAKQCVTCNTDPTCALHGVTLMDDAAYLTRELDLEAFRRARITLPVRA